MNESDYIIATNLAKLRIAKEAVRDTVTGDEWGITEEQQRDIMRKITVCTDKLAKLVDAGT